MIRRSENNENAKKCRNNNNKRKTSTLMTSRHTNGCKSDKTVPRRIKGWFDFYQKQFAQLSSNNTSFIQLRYLARISVHCMDVWMSHPHVQCHSDSLNFQYHLLHTAT